MTIELFQYRSGFGVPCPSPFCMKAEILLKMSGQNYAVNVIDDPRKSPKGKLPYIIDEDIEIADSSLIKRHLEQKYAIDFDSGLNENDKAIAHAMCRMTEERLYWVLIQSRWIDEHNWPIIANFWFGSMPPVIRSIIPILAQRQVKANLKSHGIGRHTEEEIYAFGAEDLAALSTQLGDKPFMFGDQPSSLDATAYPFIANAISKELPGALLDISSSHSNFDPYVQRCQAVWFPDFNC